MKRNILFFAGLLVLLFGYYLFDFFQFDGEVALETELVPARTIKAYITGEVVTPGVYELEEGDRLEDLVLKAGGLTREANPLNINLAMVMTDGYKVVIPSQEAGEEGEAPRDLNTMTLEDFIQVESIGEVTAKKILEFRDRVGFLTLENLLEVEGIGEVKVALIKKYLENQ
jgi:competence protein ComEA